MQAPTLPACHDTLEITSRELAPDELEGPVSNNGAARGILTGIVIGAALWTGILYLGGIIRF